MNKNSNEEITQERDEENILKERLSTLGLIISGVSHEIRNPLAYIQSNMRVLARYNNVFRDIITLTTDHLKALQDGNHTRAHELVTALNESLASHDLKYLLNDSNALIEESQAGTDRIQEVTDNINAFFKAQKLEIKQVDLNHQLEVTLKVMAHKLQERCEINRRYGNIPLVECSPGLINQVFMNLLINAQQAIGTKGTITVETQPSGSFVDVKISDTGHGIDPKDQNKIFTLFYTTKSAKEGRGVGLALSKKIIEQHNGTIKLESKPGEGTTFMIRLPIAQQKNHEGIV